MQFNKSVSLPTAIYLQLNYYYVQWIMLKAKNDFFACKNFLP